jgi:hypothetical protein
MIKSSLDSYPFDDGGFLKTLDEIVEEANGAPLTDKEQGTVCATRNKNGADLLAYFMNRPSGNALIEVVFVPEEDIIDNPFMPQAGENGETLIREAA